MFSLLITGSIIAVDNHNNGSGCNFTNTFNKEGSKMLLCVLISTDICSRILMIVWKWSSQVKIQGQNNEMLQTACQQFLGKSENDIRRIAQETLEGHQRAIMGNMTVEVCHITGTWVSRSGKS